MVHMDKRTFLKRIVLGGTAVALGGPATAELNLDLSGLDAILAAYPNALDPEASGDLANQTDTTDFLPLPNVQHSGGGRKYRAKSGTGRIWLTNPRSGEVIDITYRTDGAVIPGAQAEISRFCRDWRTDDVHPISLETIDILAATHATLELKEPFVLLSGYRSPKTNRMLRNRSSGVAKNSFHLLGRALDVTCRTRSVNQMYQAALTVKGGGVGKYQSSHFIHIDDGPIRTWGT